MGGENRRVLNLWVAYFMPFVMVGMVGYATWVFVWLVCVRYVARERGRTHTASALLAVYAVVCLLLLSSYFRIVVTLTVSPGYVKRGPGAKRTKRMRETAQVDDAASDDDSCGDGGNAEFGLGAGPARPPPASPARPPSGPRSPPLPRLPPPAATAGSAPASASASASAPAGPAAAPQAHGPQEISHAATATRGRPYSWSPTRPHLGDRPRNLAEFLDKEVFACENDGLPRYCGYCDCWKPDRSHHCSEVGRCVMKMDHFCPWVAGVVGEASFRFFYQVIVYGSVYCIFVVAAMAAFVDERRREGRAIEATWIAAFVLAAVFGTFSTGMTLSTTQMINNNLSTIDSLTARNKVHLLAIHDPHPPPPPTGAATTPTPTPTPTGPTSYTLAIRRVWLPPNPVPGQPQKCYAIVPTTQGENPWKLDRRYDNFRESLAGDFWQWFSLWGVSKPGSRGGAQGFYRWNPALVARLKKTAGIPNSSCDEKVQQR